jgi:RNA polymerase sigma factor (sigma-70 family)
MEYEIRDFFSTQTLETIEGVEEYIDTKKAFDLLAERDKKVLYLHLLDYKQKEIAEETGLSERTIRRILSNLSAFVSIMAQD